MDTIPQPFFLAGIGESSGNDLEQKSAIWMKLVKLRSNSQIHSESTWFSLQVFVRDFFVELRNSFRVIMDQTSIKLPIGSMGLVFGIFTYICHTKFN